MKIQIKGLILIMSIIIAVVMICISTVAEPINYDKNHSKPSTKGYILKEYNGCLGIFKGDYTNPIEILDVKINALPERDAEKLKKGITADTLEEIISIAEDYE